MPAPLHLLHTGREDDWDRKLVVENAPAFAILGEEIQMTLRITDDGAAPEGTSTVPVDVSVDGSSLSAGEMVKVGMRPEHLALTGADGDGGHTFRGTVDVVEELGESHLAHVVVAEGERIIVRGDGMATAREGETVGIRYRAEDGHLFRGDGSALPRTGEGAHIAERPPTHH